MSALGSSVRDWFKVYVIALAVALALTVSSIVGVNVMFERKINSIERVDVDVEENTDPGEPANFLLIGSDTRAFVDNPEEEEAFGDPTEQGGQRSDTLMIVHVDPRARTGLLVSFPRDLLVEIPGIGASKINAAFNEGPQKVIDTIALNFDIPIHHYLEIDFASFVGIVDAIGGVPVYFPAPARDEKTGLDIINFNFQPGCYELSGAKALAYVRSRNYEEYIDGEWVQTDATADIGRIERQQAFMRRLAAEAVATALDDWLRANRIGDEVISELKADTGLSDDDVKKLIQAFRSVDPNDPDSIQMLTVPWEEGPTFEGQAVLYPREEDAEALFAQLREFEAAPPEPEGPAPGEIRVRVFNGSGVSGMAARTLELLEDEGFDGAGTGNNPDGEIEPTEVRYRPESEDKARVLLRYLGDVGTLVEDDSIVEADVLLVVGEDFDTITRPPDAAGETGDTAATTAPPTSTPPDASEIDETSPPPGVPAGEEPDAPDAQC